jgi:pyrroline-5-carboxylate reductase
MGRCILSGLLTSGWRADEIVVAEKRPREREAIAEQFGVTVTPLAVNAAARAQTVLLAVKPQDVLDVLLADPWPEQSPRLVISVCAGVPLALLQAHLPKASVIRAMPNLPVQVGAGMIALAGSLESSEADFAVAEQIFAAIGNVIRLPEEFFDAVTAISGSGPAYLFLLAESMVEAGVSCGLPRDVADALTRSTLVGASKMLVETGAAPVALRHDVTSPAGTTAAAMRVFETAGFRSTIFEAVHAAANRSKELSRREGVQ